MVANPGAQKRFNTLRPINRPIPIQIKESSQHVPTSMLHNRSWARILDIEDRWRIDDEWWREQPISRVYFQILLENGQRVTIFHDLFQNEWLQQHG